MKEKPQTLTNPFYVLLVIVGIAFTLTACAYGVLTVRGMRPDTAQASDAGQGLLTALDRYGYRALMVELVIMGVATFGAILLDERRSQRSAQSPKKTETTTDASPPTSDSAQGSS